MAIYEWLRHLNNDDFIETVENWTEKDTAELEEAGIEFDPEKQAKAYQQALREKQVMESFGWNDLHKRF